jgi:hypothetical protein
LVFIRLNPLFALYDKLPIYVCLCPFAVVMTTGKRTQHKRYCCARKEALQEGHDRLQACCASRPEAAKGQLSTRADSMADIDANLLRVIDSWPNLPAALKAPVLAMIDATKRDV